MQNRARRCGVARVRGALCHLRRRHPRGAEGGGRERTLPPEDRDVPPRRHLPEATAALSDRAQLSFDAAYDTRCLLTDAVAKYNCADMSGLNSTHIYTADVARAEEYVRQLQLLRAGVAARRRVEPQPMTTAWRRIDEVQQVPVPLQELPKAACASSTSRCRGRRPQLAATTTRPTAARTSRGSGVAAAGWSRSTTTKRAQAETGWSARWPRGRELAKAIQSSDDDEETREHACAGGRGAAVGESVGALAAASASLVVGRRTHRRTRPRTHRRTPIPRPRPSKKGCGKAEAGSEPDPGPPSGPAPVSAAPRQAARRSRGASMH